MMNVTFPQFVTNFEPIYRNGEASIQLIKKITIIGLKSLCILALVIAGLLYFIAMNKISSPKVLKELDARDRQITALKDGIEELKKNRTELDESQQKHMRKLEIRTHKLRQTMAQNERNVEKQIELVNVSIEAKNSRVID